MDFSSALRKATAGNKPGNEVAKLKTEINKLQTEINKLQTEINKLQYDRDQALADKDYVWSLWKRLQVDNPDISQAIMSVAEREREKREELDKKWQEVVRGKDETIIRLERQVRENAADLFQARSSFTHSDERIRCFERENKELQLQLDQAKRKIAELESKSSEFASRQAVRELDNVNLDLKQKVSRLERQLEDTTRERDDAKSMRDSYRDRMKHLETELKHAGTKNDDLMKEVNDAKRKNRKSEPQITAMKREIEAKNKELETLRKEVADVWDSHAQAQEHSGQQANLIRQLRALQADTQAMLKNQEDAFGLETQSMQERVTAQEAMIRDLQEKLGTSRGYKTGSRDYVDREIQASDIGEESDVDGQLHSLRSELHSLRSRMDEERQQRHHRPSTRDRSVSPIALPSSRPSSPALSRSHSLLPPARKSTSSPAVLLREPRSRSQPARSQGSRSRSESRGRGRGKGRSRSQEDGGDRSLSDDSMALAKKLDASQKALENAQTMLHFKTVELEETRSAHRRRIERLKAIQTSYRLLKEQHKILEEEAYGTRNKKRRIPRPPAKALQKENSDSVWNELAYHKKEHRNLVVERMNLEEEVDKLKVQVSQDAATIHELKLNLEQERQEVAALSEELVESRNLADVPCLEEKLESTERSLEQALRKLLAEGKQRQAAEAERDSAMQQRREARSEANTYRKQEAELRIQVADLKQENLCLQKELTKKKKHGTKKTNLARKYQKSLNSSIRQMSGVFEEFDQEQVWEDVSETLEEENTATTAYETGEEGEESQTMDDSRNTNNSLGTAIMQRAQQEQGDTVRSRSRSPKRAVTVQPSSRTAESMSEHVRRMQQNKNEPPERDCDTSGTTDYQPPERRDVALSPVRFSPLPHRPSPAAPSTRHKPQAHASGRQVAALKQRITALSRQVTILKIAKEHATRAATENKKTAKDLDNELAAVQQKLDTARNTIQRLSNELDRVRDEKEDLEQQVSVTGGSADDDLSSIHAQQDWIALNNRLRSTANELSKQTAQVKQLKVDKALQAEKIQQLNDRISHLERDVSQKRALVEDLRIKNRLVQETASDMQDEKEELSSKLRSSQDAVQRLKTQLESQRVRLHAVTKDKQNTVDTVMSLTEEIEKKSKQVVELQRRCGDLQGTVTGLERTAQQQLNALAQHSEAAIDTAQEKLTQAATRIHEYNKFIKMLAHSLLSTLHQQRTFLQQRQRLQQQQEQQQREKEQAASVDPALRRAQKTACEILNITESDLAELMSTAGDGDESTTCAMGDVPVDVQQDKKWSRRWEKTLRTRNDFSMALVDIFMEKVEERCGMASDLATVK